jgi:hypothetical protein
MTALDTRPRQQRPGRVLTAAETRALREPAQCACQPARRIVCGLHNATKEQDR